MKYVNQSAIEGASSTALLNYNKTEGSNHCDSTEVLRVGKTGKATHCATISLNTLDVVEQLEEASAWLGNTSVNIIVLDFNTIILQVSDKTRNSNNQTRNGMAKELRNRLEAAATMEALEASPYNPESRYSYMKKVVA